VEKEKYMLMVDMHHIIADGISHDILAHDFIRLYTGEPLPPLRLQYKDYSEWQNLQKQSETTARQECFWLKEFEGDIPLLNLPLDYERPEVQSFEGNVANFRIGVEETGALKQIAREEEVTIYMICLSIFNVFLSKISNQEDIIVGTPAAGRGHPDLEHIIGMFVNTLALRNYPRGELNFTTFLGNLKKRTLEAFENQDYQFEDLVERVLKNRDTSRNPLFDVVLDLQTPTGTLGVSKEDKEDLSGRTYNYDYEYHSAKFDMLLVIVENEEDLFCTINYCKDLFKEETIERFVIYFKDIVSSIAADKDVKLKDIEISHDLVDIEVNSFEEDQNDFEF
jgi:hypothetical protein